MITDTHQHFWNLDLLEYWWLDESFGPLYRTYSPQELEPQLKKAGVQQTVLVQSANSYDDTRYMLQKATEFDWIAGVVGWVPLWNPREAEVMLDRFMQHPKFKGVRHLIHEEQDANWLQQARVIDGLKLLAERNLTFDAVPVLAEQFANIAVIAEKIPSLNIVIDHLAKPPIKDRGWQPWADILENCAQFPNVYGKVSGLNTAADWDTWSAQDLQPYVEHALNHFSAQRLMFGSDWPVAVLAGDYQQVKDETEKLVSVLSEAEQQEIWSQTAETFYRLS
ncbi:MAG: amidohydrolase family protein [Deinococcota bacterium]